MALIPSQRAYLRATTRRGITVLFGIVLAAGTSDRFHDVDFAEKPPMRLLNGGLFIVPQIASYLALSPPRVINYSRKVLISNFAKRCELQMQN